MTEEHEQHLREIVAEAGRLIDKKYRRGVEEYGSKLWEKESQALLDEAINEAVDQVVYLLTLRNQTTAFLREFDLAKWGISGNMVTIPLASLNGRVEALMEDRMGEDN